MLSVGLKWQQKPSSFSMLPFTLEDGLTPSSGEPPLQAHSHPILSSGYHTLPVSLSFSWPSGHEYIVPKLKPLPQQKSAFNIPCSVRIFHWIIHPGDNYWSINTKRNFFFTVLKDFVLMWTIFNLFIKFIMLLLLFLTFWFFGPWGVGS